MRDGLQILPVYGIKAIVPGDDLAEAITAAAPWLRDGDVLVVTSKIVSKAEGQLVEVPIDGPERDTAREEILAGQTARRVASRGATHIVATHHGFVMASAGIDASNVDASQLVLLPKDPDASARALRAALAERHGVDVAVIISDTTGRPWRLGLTDVALGAAGIAAIRDHRGEIDPYGNQLQITQMAVIDELSAAAELVKGKCDQVPVAVIRGYLDRPTPDDGPGAAALIRDSEDDLFSLGTAEARALGLTEAANLSDAVPFGDAPVDATVIERVVSSLRTAATTTVAVAPVTPDMPRNTAAVIRCTVDPTAGAGALVALGVDAHRLRCALTAEGLAATVVPRVDGLTIALGRPVGRAPI